MDDFFLPVLIVHAGAACLLEHGFNVVAVKPNCLTESNSRNA